MEISEDVFAEFVTRPSTQSYFAKVFASLPHLFREECINFGLMRAWKFLAKNDFEIESEKHLLNLLALNIRWEVRHANYVTNALKRQAQWKQNYLEDYYEVTGGVDRMAHGSTQAPPADLWIEETMLPGEVHVAVARLPEHWQTIFQRYYEGKTLKEIATEDGVSISVVGQKMGKIRRRLKDELYYGQGV